MLLLTKILLLEAVLPLIVQAHTTFTNFFVDGQDQGDARCVRMSNNIPQATFPISSITSPDMACGVNGETGVNRVCQANSNSVITFEFRDWPDASQPGSIDASHKGPCAVYGKMVDDASASNNAAGNGWFKLYEEDYDSTATKWCTEKLIDNNGLLSIRLPSNLQGGNYLLRPELLALQQADKTPADPQFYVGCAQIFLNSAGSAVPGDTVAIPGYINMASNAAAMSFNIYLTPMQLPYPMFGPPVYTSTYTSTAPRRRHRFNPSNRRFSQPTQSTGLKPSNCVLENANWFGIELDPYSSQSGCWNASADCWIQDSACYATAGPTGSKNCPLWETKCKGVQAACSNGEFSGPPNAGVVLTPPLPSVSVPPPANEDANRDGSKEDQGQSHTSSTTAALATSTSPSASSSASAMPSPPAGAGSTDQCGANNGGETCAAGLCCSQHGFCGTSDWYCREGCQAGFGACK